MKNTNRQASSIYNGLLLEYSKNGRIKIEQLHQISNVVDEVHALLFDHYTLVENREILEEEVNHPKLTQEEIQHILGEN